MSEECCPKFDPAPWDGQTITWTDKLFLHDHVTSLFHIPLNYGAVMTRAMAKLDANQAQTPQKLTLTDESSLWGAEVLLEAAKEIPGARMEKISGTFLCKVFEGPYSQIGAWCEMEGYVNGKGKTMGKLYFYYTTCPRCARKYGKNYVVLFDKIA